MADKVVRMSDNLSLAKPLSESLAPVVHPHSEGSVAVSDTLSNKITTSQGGGSKMDRNLQVFMQDRFSADFSQVRIHTGDKAVQMSRELGAQAFTVGRDIYFDSGKYSPGTDSEKHLLAHELTHTIQQGYAQPIQRHAGPLQHWKAKVDSVPAIPFIRPIADTKITMLLIIKTRSRIKLFARIDLWRQRFKGSC